MRVLVTGGGGFLGGAIVRRLLERGDSVRSFSRADRPALRAAGVDTRRGDLADAAAVDDACRDVEAVLHVAAKAGVWGPEEEFRRTNVDGTRHLVEACRRRGVRRLVYTSSPSVVFGTGSLEGVDETAPYPPCYEAAYPKTKAEAERLVLAANGPELATVALRPHLIWGPGDPHLFPRLLARARAGRLRRIGGPAPGLGGRGHRVDTTYVDNAADAHLAALDRLAPGSPPAGRAYFISQGEPVNLWDFIDRMLAVAGAGPVRKTISPRAAYAAGWALELLFRLLRLPGEPPMTRFLARQLSTAHWFDLTAARRDLGYSPRVSIEEGLRRLGASLKEEAS